MLCNYSKTVFDLFSPELRLNIKNSFYYFGGSFFGLLLGLFTQPVFSRYLEPYDFAVMGYYTSLQAFFIPLFSLNFTSYYLSSYWDSKRSEGKDLSFHLNFLTIANTITSLFTLGLLYLYFKLFKVNFPIYPFFFIIVCNLFFEKYKAYYLIYCRVNKSGLSFFFFTVVQVIISTGLALYFVIGFDAGAVGRMLGQTLSLIFLGILAVIIFKRKGIYKAGLKTNLNEIRKALKFCSPLILGSYLYFPVSNLDRLLLERLGNTEEFGYYNLGLTIAGYVGTFFATLYMAFEPDFYRLTSERKPHEYKNLAFIYIIILTVVALLAILFSSSVVSYLTSNRYLEATRYFNIMIISMYFYSIGDMFQQLYYSLNSTKLSLVRNALMAVFGIVVYLVLINKFEFIGAAWARVALYGLYFIIGMVLFVFKFRKSIQKLMKQ